MPIGRFRAIRNGLSRFFSHLQGMSDVASLFLLCALPTLCLALLDLLIKFISYRHISPALLLSHFGEAMECVAASLLITVGGALFLDVVIRYDRK